MQNKSGCKYCGESIYWQPPEFNSRNEWQAFDDLELNKLHKTTCKSYGIKHRFNVGDVILFNTPSSWQSEKSKDKVLYKIKTVLGDGELQYELLDYGKWGWWDKSNKGRNKHMHCKWIDKYSSKLDEEMAIALYG